MEWISVNDRLPTINKDINGSSISYYDRSDWVLVTDFKWVWLGYFDRRGNCFECNTGYDGDAEINKDVSYWMPLPEPPKGQP